MANGSRCDFRELRSLNKRISAVAQGTDAFHINLLDTMMNGLLEDVKSGTPIRTGRLKREWYITHAQRSGRYYRAEIYNNVEYAPWVENGHRIVRDGKTCGFVEGRYMLRNGMNDLQRTAPDYIKGKSTEFFRRITEKS